MAFCAILRTGAPWADLPGRYPSYQTCHRRFRQGVARACCGASWKCLPRLVSKPLAAEERCHSKCRGETKRRPKLPTLLATARCLAVHRSDTVATRTVEHQGEPQERRRRNRARSDRARTASLPSRSGDDLARLGRLTWLSNTLGGLYRHRDSSYEGQRAAHPLPRGARRRLGAPERRQRPSPHVNPGLSACHGSLPVAQCTPQMLSVAAARTILPRQYRLSSRCRKPVQ